VQLEGVTSKGAFVPVVTNAVLRRTGWWKVEEQNLVTLEQALTGVEEGNWVEMRGFVRNVVQTNGLTRFDLSTSSGEFQAWTPAWTEFNSLKGSIIRVRGVCAAVSNARHQLTGIQIWTPDGQSILTEETAPNDCLRDRSVRWPACGGLARKVRSISESAPPAPLSFTCRAITCMCRTARTVSLP